MPALYSFMRENDRRSLFCRKDIFSLTIVLLDGNGCSLLFQYITIYKNIYYCAYYNRM